jgi:hypothetical protein
VAVHQQKGDCFSHEGFPNRIILVIEEDGKDSKEDEEERNLENES